MTTETDLMRAAVDAALRGAKDQIGALNADQRKALETAVMAQRHGFSRRASEDTP